MLSFWTEYKNSSTKFLQIPHNIHLYSRMTLLGQRSGRETIMRCSFQLWKFSYFLNQGSKDWDCHRCDRSWNPETKLVILDFTHTVIFTGLVLDEKPALVSLYSKVSFLALLKGVSVCTGVGHIVICAHVSHSFSVELHSYSWSCPSRRGLPLSEVRLRRWGR